MPTLRVFDDRERPLLFGRPPARIVSLVPSDTYSVVRLGGAAQLVGRTDYCVEPANFAGLQAIPSVGGTKNARVKDILDLNPDLVLTNQEENARDTLEALAKEKIPVLVSFPKTYAAGLAHLARLARILGTESRDETKALIRAGYALLNRASSPAPSTSESSDSPTSPTSPTSSGSSGAASARPATLRAFVPIWLDPLMTIHGDTFMSDMLTMAGATNVFADRSRRYPLAADLGIAPVLPADRVADRDTRYPRITFDELVERAPELVLLPDEPYAFGDKEVALFKALDIPAARVANDRGIQLCHGKHLCWPGAMSIEGLEALRALVAHTSNEP